MTSPVKLPPLPLEIESVYVNVDGLSTYREARDCYYTMDQMHAYAEKAVREALRGQDPVAWMIKDRVGVVDPQFCWGNPTGIYKSRYAALAIIPEKDHGEPS